MVKKKGLKKVLLSVFAVLLLFIPTYLAIDAYFSAKDEPVDKKSVSSLEFCDLNNKTTSYDRSTDEGAKIIDILMNVHSTARVCSSLPDGLEDAEYISVIYHSYDLSSEYKYYFSSAKPSSSYYVDNEGNAYHIDASAAISFLDSDFSASLYDGSEMPTLLLNDSEVYPVSSGWSYQSYSGLVHNVLPKQVESENSTSCSYRQFSLKFDRAPNETSVKVTDAAGAELYSGSLDNLTDTEFFRKNIKSNCTLTVDITAKWDGIYGSNAGGEISYKLAVDFIFDPLASFTLGEESIESGEFVVLSGKYIEAEDISAVKVSVSPKIDFEATFFTDGEYIRTIIPFTLTDKSTSQVYTITINYHDVKTELSLNVLPSTANNKVRKYNYRNVIDMSTRSEENYAAFVSLIENLPYESEVYFSGEFLIPDESQNRARFGDTVNNGTESQKHISNGIAWVCYKNQPVYATNKGKVIYVGETVMGGVTIVIDHGLGLRSVYYCLEKSTVAVGDIVESGAQIATGGGNKGYTDDHTCYFELWVKGTPVSYFPLISGGRNGKIVFGDIS